MHRWLLAFLWSGAIIGWLLICLPLHYVLRLFGKGRTAARLFLGGMCRISGLRITRHGAPSPGALLLPNHISWLDIPALGSISGSAFVAHDGLAAIPLISHLCSMNDTVFISRHHRNHIVRQAAEIRKALQGSRQKHTQSKNNEKDRHTHKRSTGALTLFLEGTTSDGTDVLPFKSALLGAVEPLPQDIIIQPVLLNYANAPGIAWVGDEHGVANFIRILGQWRSKYLTIYFLEPLVGAALTSRKTMANAARTAIQNAMHQVAHQI